MAAKKKIAVPVSAPPSNMTVYQPDGLVLSQFLQSRARVAIIQGPIGSGKSLAAAMKIYKTALSQPVQSDGKIRCRAHVIRDTYGKLEETTLKTWLDWFPEAKFGKFYWSKPFAHYIRVGNLELDVHFVGLEDDRKADFFKSLETTIIWFNELQFIGRELFDEAVTRVGRYPRKVAGGAIDPMVIADMNAPDETHWVPIMRGDVAMPEYFTAEQRQAHKRPEGWEFFTQPPGLLEVQEAKDKPIRYRANPKAENLLYLPENYYPEAIKAKTKSWIDANVLNRVSPRRHGKPVFPDFKREIHVAKKPLEVIEGLPILGGADFGRQPAAVFGQYLRGRWFILSELVAQDMGASRFAPLLKNDMAQKYPDMKLGLWGDPSGDFKGQADEQTPFRIFRSNGIAVTAAPSNLTTVRLQAVEAVLTRLVEGEPAIVIDPRCSTLIAALDGGYHFRRMAVNGERYSDEPEKDQYSHIADAFQYLLLGGGEGRLVLSGGNDKPKPQQTRRRFNPFGKAETSKGLRRW